MCVELRARHEQRQQRQRKQPPAAVGDGCNANWRHLPSLSYLDTSVHAEDEPVLLAPFASSLRMLLLWDTPPSCVVPADLPHLEVLQCSPETFMRMPSLPAVTTLELVLSAVPPPLPLPAPVVAKAALLPTLRELSLCMPSNFVPTLKHLDQTACLQWSLPRCSVSCRDRPLLHLSLDCVDDLSKLAA